MSATPAARPRLVVFGYGNTSRGDDAIGPLLLAALEAAGLPGVVTVEDFQLQVEHALDLVDADLALFLDAGTQTPAPWVFYEAQPHARITASSHALLPEAVLAVYQQVQGAAPPPAFVLCVRGESFGLGEPLSPAGAERLRLATEWLLTLCREPEVEHWRSMLCRMH